jgi:2'-5' RNA ligase
MEKIRDETRFFVALLPPLEVQEYANQVIQELGDRYQTRPMLLCNRHFNGNSSTQLS